MQSIKSSCNFVIARLSNLFVTFDVENFVITNRESVEYKISETKN